MTRRDTSSRSEAYGNRADCGSARRPIIFIFLPRSPIVMMIVDRSLKILRFFFRFTRFALAGLALSSPLTVLGCARFGLRNPVSSTARASFDYFYSSSSSSSSYIRLLSPLSIGRLLFLPLRRSRPIADTPCQAYQTPSKMLALCYVPSRFFLTFSPLERLYFKDNQQPRHNQRSIYALPRWLSQPPSLRFL